MKRAVRIAFGAMRHLPTDIVVCLRVLHQEVSRSWRFEVASVDATDAARKRRREWPV